MIYVTGDTHGSFTRIIDFCKTQSTSREDIMIILGDAGINYSGGIDDEIKKKVLADVPITLFCIHGNHENRPENIVSYNETEFMGGSAYCEEKYPNLIFARDGEIYLLDGKRTLVVGGAYSIDKAVRLVMSYKWWANEQPSEQTKKLVEYILEQNQWKVDAVLTHTCPIKYEPKEAFVQSISQSKVDNSTEYWLDLIEDKLTYSKWYCGHFHIYKVIDKLRFLFEDIVEF